MIIREFGMARNITIVVILVLTLFFSFTFFPFVSAALGFSRLVRGNLIVTCVYLCKWLLVLLAAARLKSHVMFRVFICYWVAVAFTWGITIAMASLHSSAPLAISLVVAIFYLPLFGLLYLFGHNTSSIAAWGYIVIWLVPLCYVAGGFYVGNKYGIDKKTDYYNIMMTVEDFIHYRDVIIKNPAHERVVQAFYGYLSSVTGNPRLLPDVMGQIFDIDTTELTVEKGCFNGVNDDTTPPYEDVDFYVKFDNGLCVFVYGKMPHEDLIELESHAYVAFLLSDGSLENVRRVNNHAFIGG